jgi:hypothetical protein
VKTQGPLPHLPPNAKNYACLFSLLFFESSFFRSLQFGKLRNGFKTQFPLRTAAIFSRFIVGSKFVLHVALATPAAILNLRLARVNFAHSRNESSFEITSRHLVHQSQHKHAFVFSEPLL